MDDIFDVNLNNFIKPDAGDESLFVVFYMGILKDDAKSVEEGRPIYNDVECVRIIVPGDKNNLIDRPAEQSDKRRFAKQYAMFKQGHGEDAQIVGTRLTEWPLLTRAQVEEFKYLGIRTVEQLADLRDDVASRIPGGYTLKQTAGTWLKRAQSTAEAARAIKQIDDAKARMDQMDKVIQDQARIIEELRNKVGATA